MTDVPMQQRFADAMGQLLGPDFPSDIGLAVSGGGDSMAMLYLAHNWTHSFGVRLWMVTIDHGLRAESAAEAAMVAEECAMLGWPHATLRWRWDGKGNVQNAARQARLDLIDRWRGGVKHVLVAHTRDDQAETVLMRLARGSGVDGLAAMRQTREVALHPLGVTPFREDQVNGDVPPRDGATVGYHVIRPCLDMTRNELREYARVLKGKWVEDSTNDDRTYERVRIRHLFKLLAEEGVTADVLAETAARLARAGDALRARLIDAVDTVCVNAPLGQVRIARDGFAALEEETQLRMLTAALRYVASSDYRPRAAASEALLDRILAGSGGTLHGAEVRIERDHLRVAREYAAVMEETAAPGALWDGQWTYASEPEDEDGLEMRALGETGWSQVTDKENAEVPFHAARALPALWSGDELVACPTVGVRSDVQFQRYVLGRVDTGFRAFCLSH